MGAILGLRLFLILERKRIAQWRARAKTARARDPGEILSSAALPTASPADADELASALTVAGFFDRMPAEYGAAALIDLRRVGHAGVLRYPWRAARVHDDEEDPEDTGAFFVNIASAILERFGLPAVIAFGRLRKAAPIGWTFRPLKLSPCNLC